MIRTVYLGYNLCTMSTQIKNKLNQILISWLHGTVATQKWLSQKGVSRFLARKYVKGGWIRPIGPGAFTRADDTVLWIGGLYTIQQQLQLPIHAGGETALRWHGYGHTAPINTVPPLYLFGPKGTKPPSWFLKHKWANKPRYQTTDFLPYKKEFGFTVDNQSNFPLTLSSPERAMFETLLLMPRYTTFEGAADLMEGLSTLRPDMVMDLLKACKSIKVKRCFLYMAEHANHAWFKELNLSKVKLGKGKRVVVPGGSFDPKYQITVPTKTPVSVP